MSDRGRRHVDGDGWESFMLYGRPLFVRQDGDALAPAPGRT